MDAISEVSMPPPLESATQRSTSTFSTNTKKQQLPLTNSNFTLPCHRKCWNTCFESVQKPPIRVDEWLCMSVCVCSSNDRSDEHISAVHPFHGRRMDARPGRWDPASGRTCSFRTVLKSAQQGNADSMVLVNFWHQNSHPSPKKDIETCGQPSGKQREKVSVQVTSSLFRIFFGTPMHPATSMSAKRQTQLRFEVASPVSTIASRLRHALSEKKTSSPMCFRDPKTHDSFSWMHQDTNLSVELGSGCVSIANRKPFPTIEWHGCRIRLALGRRCGYHEADGSNIIHGLYSLASVMLGLHRDSVLSAPSMTPETCSVSPASAAFWKSAGLAYPVSSPVFCCEKSSSRFRRLRYSHSLRLLFGEPSVCVKSIDMRACTSSSSGFSCEDFLTVSILWVSTLATWP